MTRIEISFDTKRVKKIDTLAELKGVDRSTVVRELVEIGPPILLSRSSCADRAPRGGA